MTELPLPHKLALTGGASFLGGLLLKKFVEIPSIREIHVFDVQAPSLNSAKIIFHRVDLTRDTASSEISAQLQKNEVTTFIHSALFTGPGRAYNREVESIGTYHVLNACAEAGVSKLVVNSATFVYGASSQNPNFLQEGAALKPQGPNFVRTRVDVERQVLDFIRDYPRCSVTLLRFAPILGPNSTNVRARYFLAGVIPKVMGYDPLLQFVHEEDAVRAIMLSLSQDTSGIFNIVGKGLLPLTTAIHLAGKIPLPVLSTLCKSIFSLGYNSHLWELNPQMVSFFQYLCVADGRKAEQLLNFVPRYSSRQALKSMVEAHRLRNVGFAVPSSVLGEEEALSANSAFERVY